MTHNNIRVLVVTVLHKIKEFPQSQVFESVIVSLSSTTTFLEWGSNLKR